MPMPLRRLLLRVLLAVPPPGGVARNQARATGDAALLEYAAHHFPLKNSSPTFPASVPNNAVGVSG